MLTKVHPDALPTSPALSQKHWHLAWMSVILLVASALSISFLTDDALWYDEIRSLQEAGGFPYAPRTPPEIWNSIGANNAHTPGYFVLLSAWGSLVGWSALAQRFLSTLAGVLAIAMTYRLGRDLFSSRVDIFAALISATMALFIYYMHELRFYTLLTLLVLLLIWLTMQAIPKRRLSGMWYVATTAVVTALLYTSVLSLIFIGALGITYFIFVRNPRRWLQAVLIMVVAGVFFLPWLALIPERLSWHLGQINRGEIIPLSTGDLLATIGYSFSNGAWLLLAAAGLLLLAGVVSRERKLLFLLVLSLLVIALFVVSNAAFGLVESSRLRYLLPLMVVFALILAVGVELALRRWRFFAPLFVLIWVVNGARHSVGKGFAQDLMLAGAWTPRWHQIARTLPSYVASDDAIVMFSHSNSLVLEVPHYFARMDVPVFPIEPLAWSTASERDTLLANAAQAAITRSRVWLMRDNLNDQFEETSIYQVLQTQYAACGGYPGYNSFYVELYAHLTGPTLAVMNTEPPMRLSLAQPIDTSIGLEGLRVVALWTSESAAPESNYTVRLYLRTNDGQVQRQYSFSLPVKTAHCEQYVVRMDDLPAAVYEVVLSVQSGDTPVSFTPANADSPTDELVLGTFHNPYQGTP